MDRTLREDVLRLIEQKERLEGEIRDLHLILANNNVGLNDPLVDGEGFPLRNVDIYQVRHTRHLLICKSNDHKDLMRQIEEGIAQYYNNPEPPPEPAPPPPPPPVEDPHTQPFAIVHVVHPGSPANSAGILDGDLLVEFGSVNFSNFRDLNDLGTLVQHSRGSKIRLKLLRAEKFIRVALIPREWSGIGLIGCSIVPLS